MYFSLKIKKGNPRGTVFSLLDNHTYILGRSIQCDIIIKDYSVSRQHCKIEIKNGKAYIYDLNSSNGTYINNNLIQESSLREGDIIRIGQTELIFQKSKTPYSEEKGEISTIKKRLNLSSLKKKETEIHIKNTQDEIKILHIIFDKIHSETDIRQMCAFVLEKIFDISEAERGAILLIRNNEFEIINTKDRLSSMEEMEISSTILKEAVNNRQIIVSSNAMGDQRFSSGESVILQNIKSVMCIPIESKNKVIGAIYLDSRKLEGIFTEREMEIIGLIAFHTGTAIEKLTLMDNIYSLFMGSIRALIKAIETKDTYTKGHSDRVTSYALCIGNQMGLHRKMLANIHLGGLLHDIGKIGIDENILNKPDKLSEEEFKQIKQHPLYGVNILKNIKNIEAIVEIVKHHHERFDGFGYPEGLKGEEIPLGARILAIADTFDAITSDRPYRKGLSSEYAVEEIRKNAGTQFDPEIVKIFTELYEKKKMLPDVDIYNIFESFGEELISIWA